MENKKYTSKDAMEDLSITILKKALMKQGIHLERFPFKDKGLDVLIKVLPSSSVKIEDKKYEFLQVEDAFNRMMYGQVKSSQNDDYFLTGNKAKFSFEIQHLRMWKEAGQPVIVFLVDLRIEDKETIYWKNIDCKFKIKEEQGSQVVYLDKIIDKGCWKQFDNILIDWNKIRKKGLKIESDIRMNQLMEEFPYFDEISLLPEFTAFKEKREKWEEERNRLVFQEFNPVEWEGQMQSPTPQIGYRTLVPKTEYAKFSDPSIPVIYSMISDDIVRGIFLTEEKKLLEDLIIYSKNCNDLQEFLEFEEVENELSRFKEPLLLFSASNLHNEEFRDKFLKELFALENIQKDSYYLKSSIKLGDNKVVAIEIPPFSQMDNVSDELVRLKGMMIDKKHVEYRVKIPLSVEWRTPIMRSIVWDRTLDKRIKDPHNFDFCCFTLAEIYYNGPMIVWWLDDQI